jgi:hypothetical protein
MVSARAGKFVKMILRNPMRILDKVKEMPFSKRPLDWERISKPLKEDSNDFVNIHNPTVGEYRMTYRLEGRVKTVYDWWYSAVLRDRKGKLYFLILAFHPKWSFYRIISIDINDGEENLWSLPKSLVAGDNFYGKIGYSEHENAIDIWVQKTGKPESSRNSFARCTIRTGASRLILKTDKMAVDLTFTSLGLPFWINRGREAISSPRGDTMSGFYDVCQVEGSLLHSTLKTEVRGVGVNEHLMSFVPPDRFWKRVDGVFFCTDQVYCALIYLENKTGTRQYEYKDGAVFIRATKEYLIPIDFKIEYLEFDDLKKVPVKIRILVDTTKGELNAVAETMVAIEKQLAFRILDGEFVFKDGRKLRLTNGYGQHALH